MKFFEEIKSKKNYILYGILFLIAIIYLCDTGPDEIQPWDEAMYIVRAKSIVQNGDWLDQTNNAVGGLYSASHPPLYIWLTAISITVFGENHFSLRLPSVFFAIGIFIVLMSFFSDKLKGLLAAFIVAIIPIFYFYSHQSQLDIPVTFFILLSLFLFNRSEKNNSKGLIILSGITWGLAMMTKIIVGCIVPASLFVYFVIQIISKKKNTSNALIEFLVFLISGLLIFLPWHLYMFLTNEQFLDFFLNFHILKRYSAGVENNIKPFGVFYFVNQSIVIFSGTIIFLYYSVKDIFKNDKLLLLTITAIVTFLVISFSSTKLQHYIIILLPFLSLLIGFGLFKCWHKKESSIIFIILTVIYSFWSFSQEFRNDIENIITTFDVTNTIIILSMACISTIIVIIYLTKNFGMKFLIIFSLFSLTISLINNSREAYFQTNIEKNSELFFKSNFDYLIFIDSRTGSYTYNPQITYYFNSFDLQSRQKGKFRFIDVDSLEQITSISKQKIEPLLFPVNSFIIVTQFVSERVNHLGLFKSQLSKDNLIDKDSSYLYYAIKPN